MHTRGGRRFAGAADFPERNSMGRPTFLWGVMIGLAVVGAILLVV
jgi:hypothetical protein